MESKIIFSPQLANHLLKKCFRILNLKPKHDDPEKSVFVFKIEDGFYEAVEEWMSKNI